MSLEYVMIQRHTIEHYSVPTLYFTWDYDPPLWKNLENTDRKNSSTSRTYIKGNIFSRNLWMKIFLLSHRDILRKFASNSFAFLYNQPNCELETKSTKILRIDHYLAFFVLVFPITSHHLNAHGKLRIRENVSDYLWNGFCGARTTAPSIRRQHVSTVDYISCVLSETKGKIAKDWK